MAFTFFFRDQQVLERAVDHLVPAIGGRSRPRVWDAGVAMGQEPYTLAILLAERMNRFTFDNLRIDATDVEETGSFERIVTEGAYPREDLSRLPQGILEKYFEPGRKPGHLRVVERIRRRLVYQRHDLLSFREIGQGYSLVVCKNVLLHIEPQQRLKVFRMFHRALAPGGFFAAEHTQDIPPEIAPLFRRVIPDGQLFCKTEATGN